MAYSRLAPGSRRSGRGVMECTHLGGQFSHGLLDGLPGEVLLEIGWAAVVKCRVQPFGIVDLVDEAR